MGRPACVMSHPQGKPGVLTVSWLKHSGSQKPAHVTASLNCGPVSSLILCFFESGSLIWKTTILRVLLLRLNTNLLPFNFPLPPYSLHIKYYSLLSKGNLSDSQDSLQQAKQLYAFICDSVNMDSSCFPRILCYHLRAMGRGRLCALKTTL